MSMKKGNVVAVIESTSVEDIHNDTGKTMEINEISTGDKCVIYNECATYDQVRTSPNRNAERDSSDMDDLTARMSRLTTENVSPNSKVRTTPTGGVMSTTQFQPRDNVDTTKMVDREESTTQAEPIP